MKCEIYANEKLQGYIKTVSLSSEEEGALYEVLETMGISREEIQNYPHRLPSLGIILL